MNILLLLLIKTVLISGLALWCTVLIYNNIKDSETNLTLLADMMSMKLIKADPNSGGKKLLSRAIDSSLFHKSSLLAALVVQIAGVLILWYASYSFIRIILGGSYLSEAMHYPIFLANMGLFCMLVMWFFFLCGGLWFAYWIKMWEVQQVHMMMLIITLLAIMVVNLPLISKG